MIPKRTLTATLEISTGSMIITNRPPAFTGEADALTVSVSVLDGGAAYTPVGNVLAKLYLYWPGTINMSEAVDLTITGSTLTGSLPDTLTAVPGCPLMVIQLTDTDSGDLIVAAATPIQITNVLGERVISSRPATPSEIIYIGRSPYIDVATGHWMQWDTATSGYIDTGVSAAGRPASFSATATSLPAGSAPTASITGTPDAPVLNLGIPKGDTGATGQRGPTGAAAGFGTPTASVDANVGTPSVSVSASGPNTAKVFNFAFHNLKGLKGDTGGVSSVNGKTGVVQLNDEDIPSSAVAGATTVEEALSQQSQQITALIARYKLNVTDVTYVPTNGIFDIATTSLNAFRIIALHPIGADIAIEKFVITNLNPVTYRVTLSDRTISTDITFEVFYITNN